MKGEVSVEVSPIHGQKWLLVPKGLPDFFYHEEIPICLVFDHAYKLICFT